MSIDKKSEYFSDIRGFVLFSKPQLMHNFITNKFQNNNNNMRKILVIPYICTNALKTHK